MKHLIAAMMVLGLGACSTTGIIPILSGSVKNPVTPKVAYQIQASIDEVAIAAAVYAKRPRCPDMSQVICSAQPIVKQLRLYVNAGEDAAHKLDDFALNHPTLDASAIYTAALNAVNVAQNYALANGVK